MSYAPITKNGVESAEPLEFPTKRLTISTVVTYRGRTFNVSAEGYTMDRLCDMLDEKFGPPNGKTHAAPEPAGSPPACPIHRKPMKAMKYPSKQGHMWHCTAKVGDDGWCDERA